MFLGHIVKFFCYNKILVFTKTWAKMLVAFTLSQLIVLNGYLSQRLYQYIRSFNPACCVLVSTREMTFVDSFSPSK